jgi:hypothetical protein
VRTLIDVIGNTADWGSAFGEDGISDLPGWGRNVLEFAKVSGVVDSNGIPLNVAGTAGNDIINGGSDNDTLGGKNEV